MKLHIFIFFLIGLLIGSSLSAQQSVLPSGKTIYIPKDFQGMDLQNPESKWSYRRMACTENFVIFWEKGFGNDLSNPPQLEGHDMKVDLPNLMGKLESFYRFFRDTLEFSRPGSKCDKYRMMVMLNYSLEGTAYGGDYDGEIGALWIAPNRVQDKKLNCIAHELGHSFQAQISCDGQGEAWGGCGFMGPTPGKIEGVLPNLGLGLRIEVQPRMNVRLDFGRDMVNKQNLFYFNMTEAF